MVGVKTVLNRSPYLYMWTEIDENVANSQILIILHEVKATENGGNVRSLVKSRHFYANASNTIKRDKVLL